MAVFGAPTAYGDDAERAVRAALAVRDSTLELDERELHLDLQLRIAVNTGEALVALGARPELGEAMVAGDVVNTASRLQAAAPVNGVLVGAETYAATKDAIEYEPAEAVRAKGKAAPVEAWVALRPRPTPPASAAAGAARRPRPRARGAAWIWERVAERARPAPGHRDRPGRDRQDAPDAGVRRRSSTELGGRTVHGRSLPVPREQRVLRLRDAGQAALRDLRQRPARGGAARSCASSGRPAFGARPTTVARHLAILLGLDRGDGRRPRELFFSVRGFIESVARDQPTLLVFEDIHWADRGLLDLIELLAARLRDLPILLLVARPARAARRAPGVGRRASRLHRAAAPAARAPRTRRSSPACGSSSLS